MTTNLEFRSLPSDAAVEQRADKPQMIAGYAAVFNTLSEELKLGPDRSFREVIRPGAFAESLAAGKDIVARNEHRSVLGRTSNGTLRLVEDQRGLKYEIDLLDTTDAQNLAKQIQRRDIPYSSFAFQVKPGGDVWRREGEQLVRELRSVTLIDVSPVSEPAYMATDVALRSLESAGIEALPDEACSQRLTMRLEIAERS